MNMKSCYLRDDKREHRWQKFNPDTCLSRPCPQLKRSEYVPENYICEQYNLTKGWGTISIIVLERTGKTSESLTDPSLKKIIYFIRTRSFTETQLKSKFSSEKIDYLIQHGYLRKKEKEVDLTKIIKR